MPGTSPYMDGFFDIILSSNGTRVAKTTRLDYSSAFTLTLRSDGSVLIDTDAVASISGQAITPSSVTTSGDINVGGVIHLAPTAAVTVTSATPIDIGSPIEIPVDANVEIEMAISGRDVDSTDLVMLTRLVRIARMGSGTPAGVSGATIGVDDVSGDDSGVDLAGRFTATAYQPQIKGVAARNIRARLFVGAVKIYT